MTDLRTAAQAVIDNYELRHKFDMDVLINDLRQALAEPVEPVAYVNSDFLKENLYAYAFVKRHNPCHIPLYTTPPSVDALIAEIMDVQVWCEGNDEFLSCSYDDVVRILNRYRGQK